MYKMSRAEILSVIQCKTADKETKDLFRKLEPSEQIQKINEFANIFNVEVV